MVHCGAGTWPSLGARPAKTMTSCRFEEDDRVDEGSDPLGIERLHVQGADDRSSFASRWREKLVSGTEVLQRDSSRFIEAEHCGAKISLADPRRWPARRGSSATGPG